MTDPHLSLTETPEKVKDMPGVASGYYGIVNQSKSRMAKYTKDKEVDDFWKLLKLCTVYIRISTASSQCTLAKKYVGLGELWYSLSKESYKRATYIGH